MQTVTRFHSLDKEKEVKYNFEKIHEQGGLHQFNCPIDYDLLESEAEEPGLMFSIV